MNLAEIRKKANREREESRSESRASVPVHQFDEPEKGDSQPTLPELLEDDVEQEETKPGSGAAWPEMPVKPAFPDDGAEELREVVSAKPDIATDSRVIAVPAFPAAGAVEFSAAPVRSVTGTLPQVDLPESEPETVDDLPPVFDPVAILLEGRKAAGFGQEHAVISVESEEVEETGYHEFLCFRVGTEQYAINIMEIKEIIKPREITEVPRIPDFITGVLSLRGIIIPVFNMVTRLHLAPAGDSGKERIIVVSKGEELFGIQVDEVLQVVRIVESEMEQPPAVLDGIDREFVQGIGRHGGRMLILLNLESILDVSLS